MIRAGFRLSLASLAGLTLLAGGPLSAQQATGAPGTIVGIIVDAESGAPIPGVDLRLLEHPEKRVISNQAGAFTFRDVVAAVHEIEISHIAYGTRTQLVNVPPGQKVQLRIELMAEAIDVGSMRVEVEIINRSLEQQGFYQREDFGFGRFFDADELGYRGPVSALRQVPRLRMVTQGPGAMNQIPMFRKGIHECVPSMWIDRRRAPLGNWTVDELVDRTNIAAMEVYAPGNTPGEFMAFFDCGAIVIWTRSGNPS